MDPILPMAVVMSVCIIVAGWCFVRGTTINASVAVERRSTSIWGTLLNYSGAYILLVGLLVVPQLMLEQLPHSKIYSSGALSLLLFILVLVVSKDGGNPDGTKKILNRAGWLGSFTVLLIVIAWSLPLATKLGGEKKLIPDASWSQFLGSIVMVAGLIAASLSIMTGVKIGGDMLKQNENLSVWALLFVALGEGLAIYGLIVAILLIG